MLNFTSQEQKFIIFLIISFVFGVCFHYFKSRHLSRLEENWSARQSAIVKNFQERSLEEMRWDTTGSDSAVVAARHDDAGRAVKKRITGKININLASVQELQGLPRIGPAIARAIIEFREKNGPFRNIEEIQSVERIGPKTFEKIKNYITVHDQIFGSEEEK